MPGILADAVRAADSVQVCPHGPTCGGRLLSGLRRTVVSKERISRCFGRNTELSAAKVNRKVFSQRAGAPGDIRSPADGHKQAGFTPAVKRNARRASHAARKACLVQTSSCGTREKENVARADDGKQPEFTSGVKRSRRRASLVSVQRVLRKRGVEDADRGKFEQGRTESPADGREETCERGGRC